MSILKYLREGRSPNATEMVETGHWDRPALDHAYPRPGAIWTAAIFVFAAFALLLRVLISA